MNKTIRNIRDLTIDIQDMLDILSESYDGDIHPLITLNLKTKLLELKYYLETEYVSDETIETICNFINNKVLTTSAGCKVRNAKCEIDTSDVGDNIVKCTRCDYECGEEIINKEGCEIFKFCPNCGAPTKNVRTHLNLTPFIISIDVSSLVEGDYEIERIKFPKESNVFVEIELYDTSRVMLIERLMESINDAHLFGYENNIGVEMDTYESPTLHEIASICPKCQSIRPLDYATSHCMTCGSSFEGTSTYRAMADIAYYL